MWKAEDLFDGFTHFALDFGFELVDFIEAVGGAIGGAVADDDVDQTAFEGEDLVIAIEVAKGSDVFVEGVFVGGDVILEEGVVGAVAGEHFTFVVSEGVGEADAAEFVGVAVRFEVAIAGERVVVEGAETFAEVVEVADGGGAVGVDELGLAVGLSFGGRVFIGGLAVGWLVAGDLAFMSDLVFADGGGDFASAFTDENSVPDPGVAVAVFGGFSAKGFDEGESFGGGGLEFGAVSPWVFAGVFGFLGGLHGYIVAKILDFGRFVI